jgi:tetratricopeptide (TPR) repeat protein
MPLCQGIFNMSQKNLILIIVLTASFQIGYGQNVFTDLKSLEKRGDYYYSKLSYAKAIDYYAQAIQKKRNKSNYQLNLKAAGLYKKMGRYPEAKICFDHVIASGYRFSAQDSIEYFNILKAAGLMDADANLSRIYSGKILNDLFRDTLYYDIEELPFNSSNSEYCPVFFQNGLMYVSDKDPSSLVKKYNALNNGGFASLQFAEKKDTGWLAPQEMLTDLENVLHVGPVALYNKEKQAILNVCIEDRKKPYRLLFYSAEYDTAGKKWKTLSPMSLNSKSYSIGHPSVSHDGKKIFFVSDMRGGKGGTDIYFSNLIDGQWSKPINMGAKINTAGNEKYPYITDDNILFFSSDGRYGLGGSDIYYADLDYKDSIVINMGSPVNSNLDDFGFNFDQKNKTGYFSSNRKSLGKEDDLYLFKENKILLNIILKDDFDKTNLENATVQIFDDELHTPVKHVRGNEQHKYDAWLRPAHKYKVIVQKEDYRNDTLMVSTYNISDYSKPISKTVSVKRKSIYYAALNYQDEVSGNRIDSSLIIVNNLSDHTIDSIDHKGIAIKVKLDADCEYIITSRDKNTLRYIYVEKKNKKNISSKSYYNMYLTPAKPTVLRVIVKKCSGEEPEESLILKLKVFDWVNRNQFYINPGPDGDFQFVVTDSRLFDLYLNDNRILYSKRKIQSGSYCMSFIDN